MKFQSKIILGGKTATGLEVPGKVVAALGSSKRPAVRVTINGYTYPSTIAVMGGKFVLPVSAEVRGKANIAAGDVVDVIVELDTSTRAVTVPPGLAKALATNAAAKQFFESLSYSNQRGFTVAIEGAKTEETRERRIAKTMEALRDKRKAF